LASICFEVQSGSREDFVGLGEDRPTSSVVLVHGSYELLRKLEQQGLELHQFLMLILIMLQHIFNYNYWLIRERSKCLGFESEDCCLSESIKKDFD
jgi:hypothetical protein